MRKTIRFVKLISTHSNIIYLYGIELQKYLYLEKLSQRTLDNKLEFIFLKILEKYIVNSLVRQCFVL